MPKAAGAMTGEAKSGNAYHPAADLPDNGSGLQQDKNDINSLVRRTIA